MDETRTLFTRESEPVIICYLTCGVAVWVCFGACCAGAAAEVVVEGDYGGDVEVVESGLLAAGAGASPSFMVDNYAPTSTSSPSL